MKRKDVKYASLTVTMALIANICLLLPAFAEEEKPTADLSVSALSAYIWRGQELSRDSIVIQPSMTVGYKGFSANLWANLDTDPYVSSGESATNWTETDLTLCYGRKIGPVNAKLGYIYYGLDAVDDSQEVFISVGLDTLLSPTLTVYKEFAHYPSWYYLLGISHGFKLTEMATLNLAASVSYLKGDDADDCPEVTSSGELTGEEFSNFHDGLISLSLPMAVAEYITITPTIAYSFPLSDDAKNELKCLRSRTGDDSDHVYGGITASLTF